MKIIYLLSWSPRELGGVEKKLRNQIMAWRNEGSQVKIVLIADEGSDSSLIDQEAEVIWKRKTSGGLRKLREAEAAFSNAETFIEKFQPDLVYYRLSYPTPSLLRIARRQKFFVELNNDVVREMVRSSASGKLVNFALFLYIKMMFRSLFKKVDGLVAVTYELEKKSFGMGFRCPSEVVPNSVDIDSLEPLSPSFHEDESIPVIAFLGSSEHPDGVQRVLDLAKLTQGKLEFRVFGKNAPEEELPNVTFYGFMKPSEYVSLLEDCDVGLSTLTLYQKSLKEASSLKIREYLARGLPVIVAHQDTALLGLDAPWFLQIDNDERNVEVSIEAIINFALEMKGVRIPRGEVKDLISTEILEKKRLVFLRKCLV